MDQGRPYFLMALLLFILGDMKAQTPFTVRKGIIYKSERFMDLAIHTNGFFVGYNKGRIKTYYRTDYMHLDFGLVEHPREQKIHRSYQQSGGLFNSYTYGKQNSLWNLRAGRGVVRYFSEKARQKGVAMGIRMEGGLLLGILKPYYLKVLKNEDGILSVEHIRYSESTRDVFLDPDQILGASPFSMGLSQIRVRPGGYLRLGLTIDQGAFERVVRALNAGISVDFYPAAVPIMVSSRNPFFFPNFYVNLQFGSRSTTLKAEKRD